MVCYCSVAKLVPTDTVHCTFRHVKLLTGMSMHTGVHYRGNGRSSALTKLLPFLPGHRDRLHRSASLAGVRVLSSEM